MLGTCDKTSGPCFTNQSTAPRVQPDPVWRPMLGQTVSSAQRSPYLPPLPPHPETSYRSVTPGKSPTPSAPALSLFSKAQALRYENIPSQLRSGGALPSVGILAPPSPFETDIFRPRSRLKTFFIADARVAFPVRPNQHAHNECRQRVRLGCYEDKIVNHPIHLLQQA